MNNKIVLFTARHGLLDGFIARTAEKVPTYFFHPDVRAPVVVGKAEQITVTSKTFGLASLFTWLKLETLTPSYVKHFNEKVRGKNIDTIITLDFFRFLFVQALLYKKRHPDVKLFVYSETQRWPRNIVSCLGMWFFWQFFKMNIMHINKIFVFTEQGRIFFENRLGGKVPIVLIPAPIDIDRFFPDSDKVFMRSGIFRLVMNARFTEYKNHKDLFDALYIVKQKGIKFQLTLIGRGGHLKGNLLKYAEELGLSEDIKYIEAMPYEKMRDLYISQDILVLPSYNEAIGMVVPEAMACGIPTITSDTVGSNTYVKDGETGLVFKTGDAEDLAKSLIKMANNIVLNKFSLEARNETERHFALGLIGKKFLKEIEIV